jgi:uncharacterized protein (TIGR02145 family)
MAKNKKLAGLFLLLTFQMVSAQGFPKNCIDEILALPSKNPNFSASDFLTDLPIEVVKTKVKLKLPFGKPKDNEVTSVGITVGCAKLFPESPAQIAITIKDIGIKLAKKMGQKAVGDGGAGVDGDFADNGKAAGTIPVSSEPILKKCDFIFNPEKKFCYDGAVYDTCDGMEYNPTTHLCSDAVANRALCNNIQYNPTIQRCEGNAIQLKCGDDWYNPETHSCYDKSRVVVKCGINPQAYNPDLMVCKPSINANGIFLKTPVQNGKENYEAVLIGEQIWLARNLKNNASDNTCYDNNANNCATYGSLFDLETARTACPAGWYLPSDDEWKTLQGYVGGMADAGGKLKATSFGGTDNYGFAALPSGFGFSNRYSGVGDLSYWWSSTEISMDDAYSWQVKRGNNILSWEPFGKDNLFAIRCLQYVDARQRKTHFFLNVASEPAGAALTINGSAASSCSTPCKIKLQEGKYNINFAKDFYDSAKTTITLTADKYINMKLVPKFGILNVKEPGYSNGIGSDEQWNFTIGGKSFPFGDVKVSPGKYAVKLTHECYGDIVDSVAIKKAKRVELDVAKKVALKQSLVSLNATYKRKTVEEPVFVNKQEIGKTPFKSTIPLCSEIAIMEPENKIGVGLSENNLTEYTYKKSIFTSTFWGTALNLAGAAFFGVGLSANADANGYYKDYSNLGLYDKQKRFNDLWDKYEQKKKSRNTYYIIGGILLASGVGVHIWL